MAGPDKAGPAATPEQSSPSVVPAPAPGPQGGESHIPLAPVPAPTSAPPTPQPGRGLNAVLTGEVLLFAFLASSFAVRNSGFWQHLAAGRLLAGGEYRFGVDPFAYTTEGAYWVNPSWLFDLALYAVYQLLGGPALVVVKALVVTALAWLLLRIRRPGTGAALPAACTLLALLVMSPRLLLQPAVISCLFLGLTFWLLWLPHAGSPADTAAAGAQGRRWRFGSLLLLFILWANTDAWFILGPALVGLVWLGERLGQPAGRKTPGWLAPAGLAACLLNPHLFHVFRLPPELTPAVFLTDLPRDARFASWFLSPWQLGAYLQPTAGLSAAGLAYFVLVGLGLASFALARGDQVGWRLLVWGAFALLGAWQVRAIPFFATVAAPIAALNFQDAAATRGKGQGRGKAVGVGHALSAALVLAGLVLVVLAWPGWLQAVPHGARRVAWKVEPDPSLQRVAQTLQHWRQEGLLTAGERVFALHPDVAHYCAWFAPDEKGFLDQRAALFTDVVPGYEAVCRGLTAGEARRPDAAGWRDVLHAYGITVLVLYDPDLGRLLPALRRLTQAPREWCLLRVDGRALVFGWKAGRPARSFARLRLDPQCLALGRAEEPRALPPAPGHGPGRPPEPARWEERFWKAAPAPTWESEAATMYLRYFEDRAPLDQHYGLAAYAAAAAGLGAGGAAAAPERVLFCLWMPPQFVPGFQTRPRHLPLLAVRAARRALAANPDDANAWLRLGQAYLLLHRATGEAAAAGQSRLLRLMRHVQAAAAMEHALLLDPDLEPAHEALSLLYGEYQYLDAAFEHRRRAFELTRRGPRPGEGPEAFARRLREDEDALDRLELLVQDRRNEFRVQSERLSGDPLGRAYLALRMGLARHALNDVLLRSEVRAFGGEGARLELELLLLLGQAEEARRLLDTEELRTNKDKLAYTMVEAPARPGYLAFYRLPAYDWLHFLQAAATGDYDPAAEALGQIVGPQDQRLRRNIRPVRRTFPLLLATEVGLNGAARDPFLPLVVRGERLQTATYLSDLVFLAGQQADLYVLGGLLALERGAPAAAGMELEAAFSAAAQRDPPGDFAARPLAWALRSEMDTACARGAKD